MRLTRSSIFIKIVILAMIVYAAITLSGVKSNIERAEKDRAALQVRVDAMLQENAELEYDIEHAEDPETIAEFARTKLGLVWPGEKILFDVSH